MELLDLLVRIVIGLGVLAAPVYKLVVWWIRRRHCKWLEEQDIQPRGRPGLVHWVRVGDSHLEIVRRILLCRIDPNIPTDQGRTALVEAVLAGQAETVRLLLRGGFLIKKADPSRPAPPALTPLGAAVLARREDLETCLRSAGAREEGGAGARLLVATQDGDLQRVKDQIALGASLSARTADGSPLLLEAARRLSGNPAVLEELLRAGARIDETDSQGRTALMAAAEAGNLAAAELLIRHNADLFLLDVARDSAASLASRHPRSGAVARLLEAHGATPTQTPQALLQERAEAAVQAGQPGRPSTEAEQAALQDLPREWVDRPLAGGNALIHLAAERDRGDAVRTLAGRGADLDRPDAEGRRPLAVAVTAKAAESARALLEKGAQPDLRNADGDAAVHLVARAGDLAILEQLIRHRARLDLPGRDGAPPLLVAVAAGQREVVARLLAAEAPADGADLHGATPLLVAVLEGYGAIAQLLREHGAQVGEREARLILAAERGDLAEVEAQLAAGASPRVRAPGGRSALSGAVRRGWSAILRRLLALPERQRPELEQTDERGRTALMLAAANGHGEAVRLLHKAGAKVDARRRDGATALHDAAHAGRRDLVEQLLDLGAGVDRARQDGRSALLLAAERGHLEVVRLLIARKADVNLKARSGETALMLALLRDDPTMVQVLRGAGAREGEREAELFLAAQRGDAGAVTALLAAGVPPDVRPRGGKSPLLVAAERGHLGVVEALLDKGANVNEQSWQGASALERAAGEGHLRVVRRMLGAGASPNLEGRGGRTALMVACLRGHVTTATALIRAGADPEARDHQGRTPLMVAILEGHSQLVTLLDERGARAGSAEAGLILAAEQGHAAQVQHFLSDGAEVDAVGSRRRTALLGACQLGATAVGETLLASGADPDLRGGHDRIPLAVAARAGALDLVRALLAAGATVDLPGELGRTALATAAAVGQAKVVEVLLAAGANPDAKDLGRDTALGLAASQGHDAVVGALLAADPASGAPRASVDARGSRGRTALLAAAGQGHAGVVRRLLAAGANVEVSDENDSTALILASLAGSEPVVEALLAAGARVDARDSFGNTPLMAAILGGRAQVESLLLAAGAREGEQEARLLVAAERGDLAEVRALLDAGAHVNARRSGDDSALILAAAGAGPGALAVVSELLGRGADVRARGRGGRTALIAAAAGGDPQLVSRLLDGRADMVVEAIADGEGGLATATVRAEQAGHGAIVDLLAQRCQALRPGDEVLLTAFGDRYHLRGCTWAHAGGRTQSLQQALAAGKRPCAFCVARQ